MKGKYIRNWAVIKYTNGIYTLAINTTEKWLQYHRYNNTDYIIGEDIDDDIKNENRLYEELNIPEEFIPNEDGITYICTSMQNKDQINFYWIPFDLETLRGRQYILSSDK